MVQVGQSGLRKAARFLTSVDQFLAHRLEVRDPAGHPVLVLARPAKIIKSTVIVARPDGQEIGRIAQQNAFGKIRFDFETAYGVIGSIRAENWRAWNFAILDHGGAEVEPDHQDLGDLAKTMFTTADNYVVQIRRPLGDPLLSMAVASALSVDTALKQDDRGFG
ncbi:MAG: phospholipid scramblase-related protein [Geodermatophilaceae bacterium]